MSIPQGKTSYYGRFEDPEKFRLINQHGTRVRMLKDVVGANYNSPGYLDGPSASNILSSITLSKDEQYLAVGGADRIGAVHIFKL